MLPKFYFDELKEYMESWGDEEIRLSASEERELTERYMAGDLSARDTLFASQWAYVVKLAKPLVTRKVGIADLVQAGNIGLLRAIGSFNPTKGCRLSTYAHPSIIREMRREVIYRGATIRIPVHRFAAGEKPPVVMGGTYVVDVATEESTESSTGADYDAMKAEVAKALIVLTPVQKAVISRLIGLGGDQAMSLTEIATSRKVSHQAVKESRSRAVERLAMVLVGRQPTMPARNRITPITPKVKVARKIAAEIVASGGTVTSSALATAMGISHGNAIRLYRSLSELGDVPKDRRAIGSSAKQRDYNTSKESLAS